MRHSSKVSACRRALNAHNAAQARAPSHSRQRAWLHAPVEPMRNERAPLPRPFTSALRCIGPLYRLEAAPRGQARSAIAAKGLRVVHQPADQAPRIRAAPRPAAPGGRRSPRAAVLWLALRLRSLRAALPNPSFKPSPNGVPRGPGRRYAVHFRQPGPRVTPSVPA